MPLNDKSIRLLQKVHPDLVKIVKRASVICKVNFVITCGIRSLSEQKVLVAKGFSKTLRSRHLPGKNGLSHAVDVAPVIDGKVRWDWPPFHTIAAAMKQAAQELKMPLEWGGDWKTFKDGPHFQLPWNTYP